MARGFTLVEVLVVTAISLLLMMTGTFIYLSCLKIYRENQEMTEVMQSARLLERDLRDALGNVVPLRGAWITPQVRGLPQMGDCMPQSGNLKLNPICYFYYNEFWALTSSWYSHYPTVGSSPSLPTDLLFSGVQSAAGNSIDIGTNVWAFGGRGIFLNGTRGGPPWLWCCDTDWGIGEGAEGYLPAFYGWRDGLAALDYWNDSSYIATSPQTDGYTNIVQRNDNQVGAWGWPRPDYRLNADADLLAAGTATFSGGPTLCGNGGNVACWFYTEDRYCDNVMTLALDNNNVLLTSLKFTQRYVNGVEQTQLSMLSHHAFGIDHPYMGTTGQVRCDISPGNMLRAVSITPYYLDSSGNLQIMTDNQVGWGLATGAVVDDNCVNLGMEIPRCFNVTYRMRGPVTGKTWNFATRIYCRSNSQ